MKLPGRIHDIPLDISIDRSPLRSIWDTNIYFVWEYKKVFFQFVKMKTTPDANENSRDEYKKKEETKENKMERGRTRTTD